MTQSYRSQGARDNMAQGLCPECGDKPENHDRQVGWMSSWSVCDLREDGVLDRIDQYRREEGIEPT